MVYIAKQPAGLTLQAVLFYTHPENGSWGGWKISNSW